ncbi:MAG TPA: hypothetical protein VFJ09_05215 [Nocardioidaceae bacterium]|nr:hypothetical protein [Nocardioidaceae bacterium]
MNPFRRLSGIPAPVVERARMGPREKVLASATTQDGTWLLGTRVALYLVAPAPGEPRRIPWEQVERADWQRDDQRLVVAEVGRYGEVRPRHTFFLDQPGALLSFVRERVTASVVMQRRVVVDGRKGLFVIARRPPGGAGEISWAYEFDAGVDPADPRVAELAEQGLRAAAEELGQSI